jgi:2-desacetyl-2-hydroxyethyl bacteriochlorophyllide A dehydrogenase
VSGSTTRRCLVFTAPSQVEIRQERLPSLAPGELLVRTLLSAISAGTELMIYRGQAPAELPADSTLPALSGSLSFPLKYGYAAVGRIVELGDDLEPSLLGRLVFAFQPHQTHFVARPQDTILLPPDIPLERAVLLPSCETAVNLVHDGRPLAGEKIVIFGQGVVGLLTTALLAAMTPSILLTLDPFDLRRRKSLALGAHQALDPSEPDVELRLAQALSDPPPSGADLAFEVSGDPAVLDAALRVCGFAGRVVIGSWYGKKRAALDLGGEFHRSRIQLIASQVSTIAPELRGRWTQERRLAFALSFLQKTRAEGLITHRVDFEEAATAYRLLAEHPDQTLQVVLTYPATT